MGKYIVVFESKIENKSGTSANWVPNRQRFDDLKGAREYARMFFNSAIYRAGWTDGNGYQFIRKLKTI